jgi:hypothetical protein
VSWDVARPTGPPRLRLLRPSCRAGARGPLGCAGDGATIDIDEPALVVDDDHDRRSPNIDPRNALLDVDCVASAAGDLDDIADTEPGYIWECQSEHRALCIEMAQRFVAPGLGIDGSALCNRAGHREEGRDDAGADHECHEAYLCAFHHPPGSE